MKWISIKDQLPSIDKEVLIRTVFESKYGSMTDYWIGELYDHKDAHGNNVLIFKNDNDSLLEGVTHWAEISEP